MVLLGSQAIFEFEVNIEWLFFTDGLTYKYYLAMKPGTAPTGKGRSKTRQVPRHSWKQSSGPFRPLTLH